MKCKLDFKINYSFQFCASGKKKVKITLKLGKTAWKTMDVSRTYDRWLCDVMFSKNFTFFDTFSTWFGPEHHHLPLLTQALFMSFTSHKMKSTIFFWFPQQTCKNKQGKHSGSSLAFGGFPKSHDKSSYFSPSSRVWEKCGNKKNSVLFTVKMIFFVCGRIGSIVEGKQYITIKHPTYTFNMIDNVNSLFVNCYQNGNVLLLKKTHKTSNWLLHLAVVEGSTKGCDKVRKENRKKQFN